MASPRRRRALRLPRADRRVSIGANDYARRLADLQLRLRAIQIAYRAAGRRAVIVLEGWDASGKGGIIRRMTSALDPRGCRVWPIAVPTAEERGRHHLYRFWLRLPEPGTLAVFDRSWYGRVLVERVERLASEREWRRAYGEINAFERMLADDGVRLVKLFLHIGPDEQLRRFRERIRDPLKRWKMSLDDIRNWRLRAAYERAVEEMLARTSTRLAPWRVIAIDDKWSARLEALDLVARALARGVDLKVPRLDPAVLSATRKLGIARP